MAKYRRRNYLVDKPLQFAFAGFAIWLLLIAILIIGTTTYFITLNTILTKLETSSTFSINAYELVKEINTLLARRIGLLFIILIALAGILEIFFLHRIAGPIFKIQKVLRDVEEGKSFAGICLRKNDYFRSLAEQINRLMERVEREQKKNDAVRALLQTADDRPDLKPFAEKIRQTIQ